MSDHRCGTCASLHVQPDSDGKRRVRKDSAYVCMVHVSVPALPDCIKGMEIEHRIKNGRSRMSPNDGADCPCWSGR